MFNYGNQTKEISAFLKKHYGFTLRKSELGTGAFSVVFPINKTKVVKLSIDPYWYLLMKHLQNKNCEHIPLFSKDHGVIGHLKYPVYSDSNHDGYEMVDTPVYAVEMPKYDFPDSGSNTAKIQDNLHSNVKSKFFSDSIKHTQKHIKQFCKLSKKTLRDRAKKEKLNSWITELSIDLIVDFHHENVMEDKKNNPILLDPIYCRTLYHTL